MSNTLTNILKSPPKAVFLDLDNTLYDYAECNQSGMQAVYDKLEQMFSVERAKLETTFDQARIDVKNRLGNVASSHSRLLYFQKMMEILGIHTQALLCLDLEQTFWRSYLRKAHLFDGVKLFLYSLRAKHIQTVIITDLTAQVQFRKLIHFGIDGIIDYIVTSEEAGVEKPHPDIFNLALSKVQCLANEVWMIGDSLEKDIIGAENLGITGILTNSDKKHALYLNSFHDLKI